MGHAAGTPTGVLQRLSRTAGGSARGGLAVPLAFTAGPDPCELARFLGGGAVDSGLDHCEYRALQTGGEQDLPPAPLFIGGLSAASPCSMMPQTLLKIMPASTPPMMSATRSTALYDTLTTLRVSGLNLDISPPEPEESAPAASLSRDGLPEIIPAGVTSLPVRSSGSPRRPLSALCA